MKSEPIERVSVAKIAGQGNAGFDLKDLLLLACQILQYTFKGG